MRFISFYFRKFRKAHRVSDPFYFILFYFIYIYMMHIIYLFIYLFNAMISDILIVLIGMSLGVINFASVVKQSKKNKM